MRRPPRPREGAPRRFAHPARGWGAARILAALVLAAILVAGLAAPVLVRWFGLPGPNAHDSAALNLFGNPTGPSAAHPLGVDTQGRDVLSRMLYGLRSIVLLSLAGSAAGLLAGHALAGLARLSRVLHAAVAVLCSALRCFPVVLLGLALGLALGPGVWRLIAVIGISQLAAAGARRGMTSLALRCVADAVAIDFALTFLGDGPGGRSPQLGAMVARAGEGIVAGVPEWWALLFPGLLVLVVLMAAGRLAAPGGPTNRLAAPVRWGPRPPWICAAAHVGVAALRLLCVFALAALAFRSFAAENPHGQSALTAAASHLAATVSLLGGGAVVWALVSLGQLWVATRRRRLDRLRVSASPGVIPRARRALGRLSGLPALVLASAPAGWLGFLALWLVSENVGKLALLPGASSYVGLSAHPGRWAEALVVPWLLLGLGSASLMAPGLSAWVLGLAGSGQARVARAAGVSAERQVRQLRRGAITGLLELGAGGLGAFLSAAVVIEATFSIPGTGALTVRAFSTGMAATVADVTALAAVVIVLARLAVDLARVGLDPRTAG